jgi:hypothetical protein
MPAPSSLRVLLAKIEHLIGQADALRRQIDYAVEQSRKSTLASSYATLKRERDPFDSEIGSLARALRLRRLLGSAHAN